jgi:hypothetical protein
MKPKRPHDNQKPAKFVGSSASENADTMPPIFAFDRMQEGTGFSITCCDDSNRSAALERIFKLSQMTWSQIHNAPRHGFGTEKISWHAIKAPIPKTVTEDVTLLALRFNGKAPMVGFRDGRTFHVLYFDHSFKLYDH